MPLNQTTLAQDIKAALDDESDKNVNPAEARQRTAQKIAAAIDKYVKQGTVTVTVATTGSATAQTGTGTGSMT